MHFASLSGHDAQGHLWTLRAFLRQEFSNSNLLAILLLMASDSICPYEDGKADKISKNCNLSGMFKVKIL